MKLHNTLTQQIEDYSPIDAGKVRLYSCGPTVYDHIHIGNLSSFIYADTLHRVLQGSNIEVRHVMNFTDVDDKTIKRSQERYPDLNPLEALKKLTDEYGDVFLKDMSEVGNDVKTIAFIKATDSIEGIRQLIAELYKDGFAYITDDGVYFSIEKYRASGKKYGQLTEITEASTSNARIANDEYDKDNVHDFALWKIKKPNEPTWQFDLDGHDLSGRPGWHIECSVMSLQTLGQPFDIHTGGVDLIFPHHENEIAQSTAGNGNIYSKLFFHNEHLLVDGKKMSKSLNNFYTLRDIQEKGFDPLAFRLMVLQSHYRSQSNFSWENLESAQNALQNFRAWSDLRFQKSESKKLASNYLQAISEFKNELQNDLKTPTVLAIINAMISRVEELGVDSSAIAEACEVIDILLGLELSLRTDITQPQKDLITKRQIAREAKNWAQSDEFRDELQKQGILIRDTDNGPIWTRL